MVVTLFQKERIIIKNRVTIKNEAENNITRQDVWTKNNQSTRLIKK